MVNKIHGIFIFMAILLSMSISISALEIKYYGSMNQTACKAAIDFFPKKTFDGLRIIKFYERLPTYQVSTDKGTDIKYIYGWYLPNSIIIYGKCNRENTIEWLWHELAHHCQYTKGDKMFYIVNHIGQFEKCLNEIQNET